MNRAEVKSEALEPRTLKGIPEQVRLYQPSGIVPAVASTADAAFAAAPAPVRRGEALEPLGRLKRVLKREEKPGKKKRRRKPGKIAALGITAVFVQTMISATHGGASDTVGLWSFFICALVVLLLERKYHDQVEEQEEKEKPPLASAEPDHPLFGQMLGLFASLERELKDIPADLSKQFKGIGRDLEPLKQKGEKLNAVWKSTDKLLAGAPAYAGGSDAVREREEKTKKNLEALNANIESGMAETVSMLRALLAQVMQLKAAPRLTDPDSFAQIRDNIRQRLNGLEAVEETIRPLDIPGEKN